MEGRKGTYEEGGSVVWDVDGLLVAGDEDDAVGSDAVGLPVPLSESVSARTSKAYACRR
jgi:hypothetical protein